MTESSHQVPFDFDDVSEIDHLTALCWLEWKSRETFEVRGVDVEIQATIDIGKPSSVAERVLPYALQCLRETKTLTVEIKPTVGDDYPDVLRQMLAGKVKYLFLERYTGKGATLDQFVRMFAASGKVVIFKHEVDEQFDHLLKLMYPAEPYTLH